MPKFSLPQKIEAQTTSKTMLNNKVFEIKFSYIKPTEVKFLAGQFVSIKVSDSDYRAYSISSPESDRNNLALVVSAGHDGIGANFFKNLQNGQKVDMVGPSGRFVLPDEIEQNLVFVATGTGLAPFISMFEKILTNNPNQRVVLYFGVRDEKELFYMDKLSYYTKNFPNFECNICLSQQNPTESKISYKQGRVTKLIEIEDANTQYFICGNRNMVDDIVDILTTRKVNANKIFHEKF
jgi:ferredoxin-NADP reductase